MKVEGRRLKDDGWRMKGERWNVKGGIWWIEGEWWQWMKKGNRFWTMFSPHFLIGDFVYEHKRRDPRRYVWPGPQVQFFLILVIFWPI